MSEYTTPVEATISFVIGLILVVLPSPYQMYNVYYSKKKTENPRISRCRTYNETARNKILRQKASWTDIRRRKISERYF